MPFEGLVLSLGRQYHSLMPFYKMTVDVTLPIPIYRQVKSVLSGLISRGILKPGDQLNATRQQAKMLCVNPNTIARAYRELVMEGFLEIRHGSGSFVSASAKSCAKNRLERVRNELLQAIRLSRRSGLDWQDIDSAFRRAKTKEFSSVPSRIALSK